MNWTASYAAKLVALGLLIVLWDASPANKGAEAACLIPIRTRLPDPQPLILLPGKGSGYVYPEATGDIVIDAKALLRLACPGSQVGRIPDPEVDVECISGTAFTLIGLGQRDIKTFNCQKPPTFVAQITHGNCVRGELYQIGYDLGLGDFVRIMTACFDRVNANTIVVHSRIRSVIDRAQRAVPAIPFVSGPMYGFIRVTEIYSRVSQQETLTKLVGYTKAREYVPDRGNFYLVRGHLAAKSDFIYASQQRATFHYMNILPMWQNINQANWQILEYDVRKLASQRGTDIDVWTGGIGILRLADPRRNLKEFYLSDFAGRKAVPVPKLLFKVIWERHSGKGAVFIVVNNPHLEKLNTDYLICPNVCHRISYLNWIPNQGDRGLGYCCEIDKFRKAFRDLEVFTTKGLLI